MTENEAAWYASGLDAGIELGRRQAEAELDAVWNATARRVQALGKPESVPYDQIAERRGEHRRAERQRQILRERGVA